MKKPVAALSGPSGISLRRRFGGWSYGRSFFGFTVIGRVDPPAGSLSGRKLAAALYRTARAGGSIVAGSTGSTKAAWWEAAFDLECVVAGDGFEPPTFGL